MSKMPNTRSKLEYTVQDWLDELFPEPAGHYIANGFYSWLRSPKNKPLQLDFLVYLKGKMLFAIEIEGQQHYQKTFWQSEEEHNYLHDCDILKARTLHMIGVPLIILKADVEYTKDELVDKLIAAGVTALALCNV